MTNFYDHFALPFIIGTAFLFLVVLGKWTMWLYRLPSSDKGKILRNMFTRKTILAGVEVVSESLVHRKIWRTNPKLGFMHMTFALGWFLLIAVGWIEASVMLGGGVPLQGHVFFKFFDTGAAHSTVFSFLMDLLLLWVLAGVSFAWFKRARSKALGMKRTTQHILLDRVALTSLWCIFPLRLLAESFAAAVKGNGGFLTGSLGELFASFITAGQLETVGYGAWWAYSFALGTFFVALPFSRYMHIFTEIPLIFLRKYGIESGEKQSSFDNFQLQACSRCGICIDPCQLQSDTGIKNVQSVYFLRDRRYGKLTDAVTDNCMMCGRCESKCPVGIELNTLRLNSRVANMNNRAEGRYDYLKGIDRSQGNGKVGYFAGCMTMLTPTVLQSMKKIFSEAGEEVWWADREGSVCCGRPLKLSGETDAARKMMRHNETMFRAHGIATLVTSCPICLKVFKEDYSLEGIEILHHSEYILRLMESGRISVEQSANSFTYHDPCELGRGGGIYEAPREVIRAAGKLVEPKHNRRDALCCGSSLANTAITDGQQNMIGASVSAELEKTGADVIVTACPLCKKAIARNSGNMVADIAQVVADNLRVAVTDDIPADVVSKRITDTPYTRQRSGVRSV